uniref:Uncharacterized protein n=1 Tax=Ditylum brightwellii TaxID=49249 RepID=A0A7S4QEA4_9STRA
MPMIIMSREMAYAQYPPDDKPYLLSSAKQLDEDAEDEKKHTTEWLKEHPYPGLLSTFDAKVQWLGQIHKLYEDELEESFYSASAPEGHDVVSKVLLDKAPSTIWLEVFVSLSELRNVSSDAVDGDRFAAGVPKHGCVAYTGAQNWDAYKNWLLEQEKGKDLVLIGSIECSKEDELIEKLQEFVKEMGLALLFRSPQEINEMQVRRACYEWGIHRIVGENLYCASEERPGCASYAIQINLKNGDSAAASKPNEVQFIQMLEEKEQASLQTEQPKTYLLVQRDDAVKKKRQLSTNDKKRKSSVSGEQDDDDGDEDDDDDEEAFPRTAEYFHVLWLPREYLHLNNQITSHFLDGEGEARCMQRRFQKGNTDTGNLKIEVLEKWLDHIKREMRSYRTKLCATLALTKAISLDTSWMEDNEFPEEVVKLISKNLAAYWRTILLRKDDDDLGIGLGGSSSSSPSDNDAQPDGQDMTMSESRKALLSLLSMFGKRLESADYEGKIKFNLKIGHSRQPKASSNKKQKV